MYCNSALKDVTMIQDDTNLLITAAIFNALLNKKSNIM